MSNIKVELYYADWCPHCINFKPIWHKFKKAVDGKIKCREYEESENKELIQQKKINGFPTIRIIIDGEIEEYTGGRDYDTFYNYVSGKLNGSDNKSNNNSLYGKY